MLNREKVRAFARTIYQDYALTIPVDLDYLLKKNNIDIIKCRLPHGIAGMTPPIKKNISSGLILINKNLIRGRERFTIAHEFYHCLKHSKKSYFSLMNSSSLSIYERESDIFATELLMPKQEILKAFYQEHMCDIGSLSHLFDVSKQAMEIRLKEFDLIDSKS